MDIQSLYVSVGPNKPTNQPACVYSHACVGLAQARPNYSLNSVALIGNTWVLMASEYVIIDINYGILEILDTIRKMLGWVWGVANSIWNRGHMDICQVRQLWLHGHGHGLSFTVKPWGSWESVLCMSGHAWPLKPVHILLSVTRSLPCHVIVRHVL